MREWAEDELVIPTGPYAGQRYRTIRQPFTRLWFDAVESGRWSEFCGTGPSQSGKSLSLFVIPILYHLLEHRETVIVGLPTLEMAKDKWERDLLPVIEKTSYRDLLPRGGSGSRGGHFTEMGLRNGATIKFMSSGGGDKSRAYYTSRVIVFTETDGMQAAQSTSAEANPIEQIKARARAYSIRERRIFAECTVTNENGWIWDSIHRRGTGSQIALRCPHCCKWTTPGRDDLHGWREAESDMEAAAKANFYCPSCGEEWTEDQRVAANRSATLLHKGQEIDGKGEIVGPDPQTLCFGLRVSAVNNCLLSSADVAVDEWEAARKDDDPDTQKKLFQFVWALPYTPGDVEQVRLDRDATSQRKAPASSKGSVPDDTDWITVGVDVGKYRCHWTAIAYRQETRSALIFDYGTIEFREVGQDGQTLDANHLGFDHFWRTQFAVWRDRILAGWPGTDGARWEPDKVLIDARYQGDDPDRRVIYDYLREIRDKRFMATVGVGSGQVERKRYRQPRKRNKQIQQIGHHYFIQWSNDTRQYTVHVDSDQWKTILHMALAKKIDQPGSLVMFDSMNPNEHRTFVRHLTAEHRVQKFEPGRGTVQQWEVESSANHWLDATVYAFAAGHLVGFRLHEQPTRKREHVVLGDSDSVRPSVFANMMSRNGE
jgi:phage terminase large subunit GpA-like protein